jgi:hypothetical protein
LSGCVEEAGEKAGEQVGAEADKGKGPADINLRGPHLTDGNSELVFATRNWKQTRKQMEQTRSIRMWH